MDQITEIHVQRLREEIRVLQAKYYAETTPIEKQEIAIAMGKVRFELAEELGVGWANLT
ncbi:MAG: hypothetical protein FD163_2518 [Hyphomonadaceae bacterium]|nr:MAG: hypothetical protein FD128_1585 [Hyphomonadaceae bacterium]KAF0182728.1 MAG: hypothetical protein FD163_2518 [Hyphomonadaceae bacterium]